MPDNQKFSEHFQRGRELLRKRQFEKAIQEFARALEYNPDRADGHEAIATAYFLTGNYPKAAEHFERVTRLRPTEAKGFINLGAVYNRMKEYAKAVQVLQKGIQRDRKAADGYYNLGIAQRHLKQPRMAETAYREAIRLNPNMYEAHLNLGNVYMELKQPKKAIDCYKKALEIKPDFEPARRALEAAQATADSMKAAEKPFGRLVDEKELAARQKAEHIRTLSPTERMKDREFLTGLSEQMEEAARNLASFMSSELEPKLLKLSRTIAQGREAIFEVPEAYQQLRAALKQTIALRKHLHELAKQLFEHEEQMKAG